MVPATAQNQDAYVQFVAHCVMTSSRVKHDLRTIGVMAATGHFPNNGHDLQSLKRHRTNRLLTYHRHETVLSFQARRHMDLRFPRGPQTKSSICMTEHTYRTLLGVRFASTQEAKKFDRRTCVLKDPAIQVDFNLAATTGESS